MKGGEVMGRLARGITVFGIVALTAAPALSGNPHYLTGPTCVDNGDSTVTCSGDIAGLGNENIDVVVTASGTTTCENRGNKPPTGQEPSGLDTTSTGEATNVRVKNGRASFSVTTVPENPCPDQMIALTTFDSATLTVFQPSGSDNVVLETTVSF
jgi:hypothetical protein